jgi:hypothetical protein
MGHTVKSQRMVLDLLLGELKQFGRALPQSKRKDYERLLKQPLKYFSSIGFACSINPSTFLLLAIILEQNQRIRELEELYEGMANGYIQEEELNHSLGENS